MPQFPLIHTCAVHAVTGSLQIMSHEEKCFGGQTSRSKSRVDIKEQLSRKYDGRSGHYRYLFTTITVLLKIAEGVLFTDFVKRLKVFRYTDIFQSS